MLKAIAALANQCPLGPAVLPAFPVPFRERAGNLERLFRLNISLQVGRSILTIFRFGFITTKTGLAAARLLWQALGKRAAYRGYMAIEGDRPICRSGDRSTNSLPSSRALQPLANGGRL